MQGHNLPHRDLWVLRALSFKSRRWDLRDRSEAESTASHGSRWVTLATGRVVSSARALAMQGKPALNRCTTRMSCRWGVAPTRKSLRCILFVTYNVCMYIYIYIYLCIAYISSHSKGPEQDQLRSPFVPYVRNTAERSIHNFDSGPYIHTGWWFGTWLLFSISYMGCHPSHWRTHIFQDGYCTTNQIFTV